MSVERIYPFASAHSALNKTTRLLKFRFSTLPSACNYRIIWFQQAILSYRLPIDPPDLLGSQICRLILDMSTTRGSIEDCERDADMTRGESVEPGMTRRRDSETEGSEGSKEAYLSLPHVGHVLDLVTTQDQQSGTGYIEYGNGEYGIRKVGLSVFADHAGLASGEPYDRENAEPINRLRLVVPPSQMLISSRDKVDDPQLLTLYRTLFANAQQMLGPKPYPRSGLHHLKKITIIGYDTYEEAAQLRHYSDGGATFHFARDHDPKYGVSPSRTLSCIVSGVEFMNLEMLGEMTRPFYRRSFHLHLTTNCLAREPNELLADLPFPSYLRRLSISFPAMASKARMVVTGPQPKNVLKIARRRWVQKLLLALHAHARYDGNMIVVLIGVWGMWQPKDVRYGDVGPEWEGLLRLEEMDASTASPDDLYQREILCDFSDQGWYKAGKLLVDGGVLVYHGEADNVCAAVDRYTRLPSAPHVNELADAGATWAEESDLDRSPTSDSLDEAGTASGPDGSTESADVVEDGSIFVTFHTVYPHQHCPECGHLYCSLQPLGEYASVPHDYTLTPSQSPVKLFKFNPAAKAMPSR